ncbi:compass component spp1 [Lecanosticta acicola]|uniref:Compass component spp1 n=1 Tax=Lecanosticta acicola TaxID=111012 RepID=A0AAI8YS26_9PEZI|nr:compass component spp1 [Lecanosticta acicola]
MPHPVLRPRQRSEDLRELYRENDANNGAVQDSVKRHRLRRIKAYSALATAAAASHDRPRVYSLPVSQDEVLERFTAKNKPVVERKTTEVLVHKLFTPACDESPSTASDFSCTGDLSNASTLLHRKSKAEDLRSRYALESKTVVDGGEYSEPDTLFLGNIVNSETTATHEPVEEAVYCICRRPLDAAQGEMVKCDVCSEWFHLHCVGQGHRDVDYFADHIFFCPDCETIAFQEMAADEEKAALTAGAVADAGAGVDAGKERD